MKYIVCFSGGHSSALAAIETVRKYGKENVILLNHDISPNVEHADIKRFKQDIANYLDVSITYANMPGWETNDPLDVCVSISAFKAFAGQSNAFCTNRLKTEPFKKYLRENYPSKPFESRDDVYVIYGFDKDEPGRIQRRVGVMAEMGYKTDYPLALWGNRTIFNTEEIGIKRPITYEIFRHANCIGCLKSGKQQWYVTFCLRPDLWEKAKRAEESIGYSILKDEFLIEIEPQFNHMKATGIIPSEKMKAQTFWAAVKRSISDDQLSLPCECAV
jgi:hypothetical protein